MVSADRSGPKRWILTEAYTLLESGELSLGRSWRLVFNTAGDDKNWSEVHLGVSENSVPLNPMVNDHYPY